MREPSLSLGRCVYLEWLIPIADYYTVLYSVKKQFILECLIPVVISICLTIFLHIEGSTYSMLNKMSGFLPSCLSILIGFSIMLITILLTAQGEKVDRLHKMHLTSGVKIRGKQVSLYRAVHIRFSHSVYSEIFLLIIMIFVLLCELFTFYCSVLCDVVNFVILLISIYYALNILLTLISAITNIYFTFYSIQSVEVDK